MGRLPKAAWLAAVTVTTAHWIPGLASSGPGLPEFAITSPARAGLTADRNFTVTWRDGDAGDAILTWYYAADPHGTDRRRVVTLFHDDFQDGATDRWSPRANSRWRIVPDPREPENLVARGETNNEYLGTTRDDFGDVVVSARLYSESAEGIAAGVSVRYHPEGEPPAYRLRGNLRLWKRPGNTGLAEATYPAGEGWYTYELAARNLEDGAVALEGWIIGPEGKLLNRLTAVDREANRNAAPAAIALHGTDYYDEVYVDPVSARFVRDPENRFVWDTSRVPDGSYYLIAEIRDGDRVATVAAPHPVAVRHAEPPERLAENRRRLTWSAPVGDPARAGGVAGTEPTGEERAALAELGERVRGFLVWESNRTGQWELYRINADGSGFRQLTELYSPDNPLPYRSYLRPRVSPDGKWVLFGYGRDRAPVELWVVPAEGGEARKLTTGLAADWTPDGKGILFIRGSQLWRYEFATGKEEAAHAARMPVDGREGNTVVAIHPDLKSGIFRINNGNEYVTFEKGETVKRTGGCEPGFTPCGRFFYWVQGPRDFRLWEIATGEERPLLGTPPTGPFDYTYFPVLSRDGRWLAYGASPGQHDHSTSDYEIYVVELEDYRPVGQPVRLSWHPNTDRWPTLWVERGGR